jgi:MSHA biogenesis protein MshP
MLNKIENQLGVSLIAAIFIIVILAFMGTMLINMVNTSIFTSVNDLQSTQALSIAEGGTEYTAHSRESDPQANGNVSLRT